MVDATEGMEGKYLTAETVKRAMESEENGEVKIVIKGEGMYETVSFGEESSTRLSLPVELQGKLKRWMPNKDSVSKICMKYGKDTKNWVEKKIELHLIKLAGRDVVVVKNVVD